MSIRYSVFKADNGLIQCSFPAPNRHLHFFDSLAPEFATPGETGESIPVGCGCLMVGSFVSDLIAVLGQVPSDSDGKDNFPVVDWPQEGSYFACAQLV